MTIETMDLLLVIIMIELFLILVGTIRNGNGTRKYLRTELRRLSDRLRKQPQQEQGGSTVEQFMRMTPAQQADLITKTMEKGGEADGDEYE